jgi:hypothetical protein
MTVARAVSESDLLKPFDRRVRIFDSARLSWQGWGQHPQPAGVGVEFDGRPVGNALRRPVDADQRG